MQARYEQFDPLAIATAYAEKNPEDAATFARVLASDSLHELRAKNSYWFQEPMSLGKAVARIWSINVEITRRGVAPRWRGAPLYTFDRVSALPPGLPTAPGKRTPLSESQRQHLIRRWIDMEWLRSELGAAHMPTNEHWHGLFTAPTIDDAARTMRRICYVHSTGNGKSGMWPAWRTALFLAIPRLHKRALLALIDHDAGQAMFTLQKRLDTRYRPRLEALMRRPRYKLTRAQVEHRMLQCAAIDLARGSPTNAALAMRWMTGEQVSRQSMLEARRKIAAQLELTQTAWCEKSGC